VQQQLALIIKKPGGEVFWASLGVLLDGR